MSVFRTYLFVPSNKPTVMEKAIHSKADSVILDLEDAVAVTEKEKARLNAGEILSRFSNQKPVYVRINDVTTPFWKEDLAMAIERQARGVFIPKAESSLEMLEISNYVQRLLGRDESIELIPIIESARGVLSADTIVDADPLIKTLAFGSIDFALDIGCDLTESGEELLFARSKLVIASKAASKENPIDAVYPDLGNQQGLLKETKRVRSLGFRGKLIIHPKQIDTVHDGFRPRDEELIESREIVKAFEKAEEQGLASISVNNKLVDYPVYKRAKALLEQYQSIIS